MAINKKEIEEQELESGSQNYYILGEPLIDPEKSKYLNHPAPKKKKQKNYKNAEKGAPNRDKPTTASGKKGLKDLPSLMASVDPKGISSVAPMMYQMLGQISSASKGGSQSSRKKTVEDAFTGALSILANKYTFDYLTLVFDNALKDNKIKLITVEYQEVVKNALANLYTNYIQYGEKDRVSRTCEDIFNTIEEAKDSALKKLDRYYELNKGNIENFFEKHSK